MKIILCLIFRHKYQQRTSFWDWRCHIDQICDRCGALWATTTFWIDVPIAVHTEGWKKYIISEVGIESD
jgi:hypothetical protein